MIDTAIAILLGQYAGVDDRVYSGAQLVEATQGVPKIVFTYIDGPRNYTDDGADGMVEARYQLDIFALDPNAARAITIIVRGALDGYAGIVDGTKIDRIHFPEDARMEKPDPGQAVGQSATAARYSQDLIVNYRD